MSVELTSVSKKPDGDIDTKDVEVSTTYKLDV